MEGGIEERECKIGNRMGKSLGGKIREKRKDKSLYTKDESE